VSDQLTPTAGSAWRKPRETGYTVRLPSGNVATLRPVALDSLLATGRIPDLLSPIVAKTIWSEAQPAELAEQGQLAKGFIELIALIVPLAMLTPRVVENPQAEDEISMEDLELGDKIGIFNLATGGASLLTKFCQQQAATLEPLPDREDPGATA
jgi:hypothetical protein